MSIIKTNQELKQIEMNGRTTNTNHSTEYQALIQKKRQTKVNSLFKYNNGGDSLSSLYYENNGLSIEETSIQHSKEDLLASTIRSQIYSS